MKIMLTTVLLIASLSFAGNKDPKIVLDKVKQKLDRVNDYTARVLIKIDVDFLKVDDSRAKIFFKQPDRFKMEAEGFAMIPRASLNFSPLRLLQQKTVSVYIRSDTLRATPVDVIKLLPVDDHGKIILASLWIDTHHSNVLKIEASTKDRGTFSILFSYGKQSRYGLPDTAAIFFDVSRTRMPHFSFGKKNMNTAVKGRVKIIYSHYQINKGLKDRIFEEETEEELD